MPRSMPRRPPWRKHRGVGSIHGNPGLNADGLERIQELEQGFAIARLHGQKLLL